MARICFATAKQRIAEFAAEQISVERQEAGLLLTAQGQMEFQDTALLEQVASNRAACNMHIEQDGAVVINQSFTVTFFTLEADQLIALLE